MYILDEPSIGLHQRDNERLLGTLTHLRDIGNTVIVVEHDEDAIRAADYVVDLGPGAGVHGGEIVAQGTRGRHRGQSGLADRAISGRHPAHRDPQRTKAAAEGKELRILGAIGNNLRDIDAAIPVGTFCCVTGVSGSGKSTLINDTLHPVAARRLNNASLRPAPHHAIEGLEHFDKVVDIDQSPIGRTPRSNPATYTGLFNLIRDLFAAVPEARSRGYTGGRFSFNVKGGRCEACKGDGLIRVEMHFLPDVYVQCDVCGGRRYNRETLEIRYKGKTIDEVLDLTVEDALAFFAPVQVLKRKLQTLMDVGLGYVRLGQTAVTLSGGEAQRIKLSRELSKRDTGRTLYILDEPTTGLHFHDVKHLLAVLAPPARRRQHRGRHRAQPRRHQDRRLDHRPRPGRRRQGRPDHRRRHARGDRRQRGLLHRPIPEALAGAGLVVGEPRRSSDRPQRPHQRACLQRLKYKLRISRRRLTSGEFYLTLPLVFPGLPAYAHVTRGLGGPGLVGGHGALSGRRGRVARGRPAQTFSGE